MMDDIETVLKGLGDHAAARNAAAASQMYDALVTIRNELFCTNPSVEFMKHVVTRAIPKG